MRWLVLVGVLVVIAGVVSWPFVAIRSMPAKLEAAASRTGTRFSVTDASSFAEVFGAELTALGLTVDPEGLVVTMSAAEPIGDGAQAGIERSVTAQVAARRPALFGAFSVPVVTTVKVRGVVQGGAFHHSSQWPPESARLALLPSSSGKEAVVGEPPSSESQFVWSVASADSAVSVISLEAKGGCELRCEQSDGGVKWAAMAPCKVKRTHLRFVSGDCERLLAMDSSTITAKFWENTVVATVFRRAETDYEINAVTVIGNIDKVRASHGWLRGLSDVSGPQPAYGPDGGTVDFVTVDGRTHSIPLAVVK
ncbi:MAG: hypothetical protein Q8S33_16700 [Myxococcales bacterium]|nr:hypothetical protein [Myxococcales bacterium]